MPAFLFCSLRGKSRPRIPTGTEKAVPIPISRRVPMIAFEIPPPISPTGLGSWVRKFQLIAETPLAGDEKEDEEHRKDGTKGEKNDDYS